MLVNAKESQLCNRRISKEFDDIKKDPVPNVEVSCDPKDNLNWYCRINDLSEEEYKDGEFIFNIKLSPRYYKNKVLSYYYNQVIFLNILITY